MSSFYYLVAQVIKSNELNVPKSNLTNATFANVLQIVFGIAGGIALLSITYGALKYVMSQGDSSALAKAKDTLIYSIVGLIICMSAFAIVSFVIGRV